MLTRSYKPFLVGVIVLFVAIVVAKDFGWYDQFFLMDKVFHVLGGAIVAWFAWSLWAKKMKADSWWVRLIFFVGVVALVGLAWEWLEYLSSISGNAALIAYIHIGDLADTLKDLLADMVGGSVASLLLLYSNHE